MQELEFIKQGSFSAKELDAFVSVLQLAGEKLNLKGYNTSERKQMPSADTSVSSLESMGVRVYGLDEPHLNSFNKEISWENIAGYHQQKRYVEYLGSLCPHAPSLSHWSYVYGRNYPVHLCSLTLQYFCSEHYFSSSFIEYLWNQDWFKLGRKRVRGCLVWEFVLWFELWFVVHCSVFSHKKHK